MSKHPEDDYMLPAEKIENAMRAYMEAARDTASSWRVGERVNIGDPAPPDMNPKTRAGGMSKVPLHLVPPIAVAHMAMGFADGGMKYQPYNWRAEPISASVYYGAALRHLMTWWEGEDTAADSGVHHLAHAMCCLAMILDTEGTDWLNDNRPPPRDMALALHVLADGLPGLRDRPTTKFDLHDIAGGNDETA